MRHKSESSFLVLEIILENSIEVVPDSSTGKESACNAGDPGSIPGLGWSLKRRTWQPTPVFSGFPGGSDSKESTCNAGNLGSILCLWDSPGKNTGVGCHSLLQGIFPTQGSNPGLLHYRQVLYHLSHQRKFIKANKKSRLWSQQLAAPSWHGALSQRSLCGQCRLMVGHACWSPTTRLQPLLSVKGLHLSGLSFLMVTESTPTSQNKGEDYLFVYSWDFLLQSH